MDIQAIIDLIKAAEGGSFFDLWTALKEHAFKELPPGRWNVQVDTTKLGHVVSTHHMGLDDVDGAWATWAWTQGGQARVLHVSSASPGSMLVTVDGDDKDNGRVRVTTGSEGQFPHVFIIIHVLFTDADGEHDYRFAGRMQ